MANMAITVKTLKAVAADIGADWQSSAVWRGVYEGMNGIAAADDSLFPKIKGWDDDYRAAHKRGAALREA